MALVSGTTGSGGEQMAWPVTMPADRSRPSVPRGAPGAPSERATLMQATVEARTALEAAVAATAAATQRVRSVTAALEEALELLAETSPASAAPPARAVQPAPHVEALSPREREVLALVAEGRSNKAIANELFVSPNTIKTHVASLLTKLRAKTRVQLAVIAARQGTI